jgi:hypothetical protein
MFTTHGGVNFLSLETEIPVSILHHFYYFLLTAQTTPVGGSVCVKMKEKKAKELEITTKRQMDRQKKREKGQTRTVRECVCM